MATKNSTPVNPESSMEIMEVGQAKELVQAMEARGDFKFKGIFNLFNLIMEWTGKYGTNHILPTMDQLEREFQLPREKLQEYITELLGTGASDTKYIFPIPSVEVMPNGALNRHIVFCRPLKEDGPTVRRYVQSYIDKNTEVLVKWIKKRPLNQGPEFTEIIHQSIARGRLLDTQAGTEIARLFYNDLDNTPEKKKVTYSLMTKPIIQKLISEKGLLLLKPPPNSPMPNYRGVYFHDQQEIEERFQLLGNYFLKNISPAEAPFRTRRVSGVYRQPDSADGSFGLCRPVHRLQTGDCGTRNAFGSDIAHA